MSEKLVVKIRPALEADASFIFNSWLKSFRENGIARPVSNEVYFAEQHKLIEKLLKRCTTVIACNPTDPAQIFGWACFERVDGIFVLHYVYIKHPYRLLGLAKELLKEANHDFTTAGLFTHWTAAALKLHEKKNLLYHPYILINYGQAKSEG
jgi:hypothetical protein